MSPSAGTALRSDLLGAAVWIVLGAAITTGAWTMDRLERFQVKPYEAPGLVPGLLGVLVLLLGLVLLVRSLLAERRLAEPPVTSPSADAAAPEPVSQSGPLWPGLGLSLTYVLVLVGRGLPFWFATFVYVSAFVALLDGDRQMQLGRSRRAVLLRAAIFGAMVSAVVTLVFQSIFLVRLP